MRQCHWHEVKCEAVCGRLLLLEFAGNRTESKAARTSSWCGCVKDVLPHNYRK